MKRSVLRAAVIGPCAVASLVGCSATLSDPAPSATPIPSPSASVEESVLPSLVVVEVPESFARVDESAASGQRVLMRSDECDVVVKADAEPYSGSGTPRSMSVDVVDAWRAGDEGTDAGPVTDVLVPQDGEPTVSDLPDTGVNFVSQSWTESDDGQVRRVRAAARVSVVPSFSGELATQSLGFAVRCQGDDVNDALWESVVTSVRPDLWVPVPEALSEWAELDGGEPAA